MKKVLCYAYLTLVGLGSAFGIGWIILGAIRNTLA